MFNPNPYYMAARRYEISLRVRTSEILFKTGEEKLRISKRSCNVTAIFSGVKKSSFVGKACLVFHGCLYNKYIYCRRLASFQNIRN